MTGAEKRAFGRNLADFLDLNQAEEKLRAACYKGEICVLGDDLPARSTPQNTIRAGFLRFMILGGDATAPVHECGVQVQGGWIRGPLDLSGAESAGDLYLTKCWFDERITLHQARIKGSLVLAGSRVKELAADGLRCEGSVFLRNGFKTEGEVRLLGAKIGGVLDCSNSSFAAGGSENALNADRIEVNGGVFLHNDFKAEGEVRLLGAKIGGDLTCSNSSFAAGGSENALNADRIEVNSNVFLDDRFKAKGEVRLLGAKIGGNLECSNSSFAASGSGNALNADRIEVNGSVFLKDDFKAEGEVRLLGAKIGGGFYCMKASLVGGLSLEGLAVTGNFFFRNNSPAISNVLLFGAHVGNLVDDEASWGDGLDLQNFAYDAISGNSPLDARMRLAWLDKQEPTLSGKDGAGEFFVPHPWLQLKKVLREAGHNEQARQVGIALEERRRHCGKVGNDEMLPVSLRGIHRGFAKLLHWLFGAFAGYGYRPLKVLYWSIGIWLVCAAFYDFAVYRGAFAPSSAIILNDPKLLAACSPVPPNAPPNPRHNWYLCSALPNEYTGFNPLVYSLNVLLPVVDLQQEQAWGPITPTPSKILWPNVYALFETWGGRVQLVIWAETLYGWIAGAMLIAVLTGLTRKQDEE